MKQEKTVLKRKDIKHYAFGDKVWAMLKELLEVQAKVSYEAGVEKGRKEVVDWIDEHDKGHYELGIWQADWQKKRKEWGL